MTYPSTASDAEAGATQAKRTVVPATKAVRPVGPSVLAVDGGVTYALPGANPPQPARSRLPSAMGVPVIDAPGTPDTEPSRSTSAPCQS